jgi:hypothetical protein
MFALQPFSVRTEVTHAYTSAAWPSYIFFRADEIIPELTTRLTSAERKNKMARYGKAAGKSVKSAMHREKRGTLRSGKGGKGGRVKSRKQAIAIGLSEARKKGAKVPRKKAS